MRLKGWFFVLEVDLSTDSHTTLVRWLASKKLSHLFSEENKRISYYSFSRMGREWLIARSSCEIVDPAVWSSEIEIDDTEPVRFFVRVYATKIIRPPNLTYEVASRSNVITTKYVICDEEALNMRLAKTLAECGIVSGCELTRNLSTVAVKVWHKRQSKKGLRHGVDFIVVAKISDTELFKHAWQTGTGIKRVYGFGAIRLESEVFDLMQALRNDTLVIANAHREQY